MKCNFPQKWTVSELSAIQKRWSGSKKSVFESPITQKQFIFEHSYFSYGKRQKELYFNCYLVYIVVSDGHET